jgi:hypothetical protein
LKKIAYRKNASTTLSYNPATLLLEKIYSAYTHASTKRVLQNLSISVNQNGSVNQIIDNFGETDYGHINRSGTFEYNWKDELTQATRYEQKLKYAYLPSGSFALNQEFSPQPLSYPANAETTLIPASTPEKLYQFDGFGQIKSSPRRRDLMRLDN